MAKSDTNDSIKGGGEVTIVPDLAPPHAPCLDPFTQVVLKEEGLWRN